MINIKNPHYVLTAVKPDQYPEDPRPAIALLGRSNVGKSSLINTLARRKNMARVGAQPGKTRTINFYELASDWYLVDLPGYGYAKVAQTERAAWRRMIETFMDKYQGEKFYLLLLDIRHEPSKLDLEIWDMLLERGEACGVVATKADKISRNQQFKNVSAIAKALNIGRDEIVVFSSEKGEGRDTLLEAIEGCLEFLQEEAEGAAEAEETSIEEVEDER